eukprot:SAG31_NODE_4493_length_3188_cov_2.660084_6_plen_118_part_00
MALSWAFTVTQCPAMSVPIGFSSQGLPVGIQILARPFAEPVLFAAAAAYEAAHPSVTATTPTLPVRPDRPFQADINGPRTKNEAKLHGDGKDATLDSLFMPLVKPGWFAKSSLSHSL